MPTAVGTIAALIVGFAILSWLGKGWLLAILPALPTGLSPTLDSIGEKVKAAWKWAAKNEYTKRGAIGFFGGLVIPPLIFFVLWILLPEPMEHMALNAPVRSWWLVLVVIGLSAAIRQGLALTLLIPALVIIGLQWIRSGMTEAVTEPVAATVGDPNSTDYQKFSPLRESASPGGWKVHQSTRGWCIHVRPPTEGSIRIRRIGGTWEEHTKEQKPQMTPIEVQSNDPFVEFFYIAFHYPPAADGSCPMPPKVVPRRP